MHSRHKVIAPMRCLLDFAQSVKVKRVLEANAMEPAQTFWRYLMGVMSDRAAIEWSKVFGAHGDDTHWTRAISTDQHDDTRRELLNALGMNDADWTSYRDSIVGYRNQIAAHHDLDADVKKYPHYDIALKAAYSIYARLYLHVNDNERGGLPESLKRWSDTVARNMTPIIRHAFEGSAKLGSNMKAG